MLYSLVLERRISKEWLTSHAGAVDSLEGKPCWYFQVSKSLIQYWLMFYMFAEGRRSLSESRVKLLEGEPALYRTYTR